MGQANGLIRQTLIFSNQFSLKPADQVTGQTLVCPEINKQPLAARGCLHITGLKNKPISYLGSSVFRPPRDFLHTSPIMPKVCREERWKRSRNDLEQGWDCFMFHSKKYFTPPALSCYTAYVNTKTYVLGLGPRSLQTKCEQLGVGGAFYTKVLC